MKVKELLADPASWTQGQFARDIWGRAVDVQGERAICWCIGGGIRKCYPDSEEWESVSKKILRVIDPAFDPENKDWRLEPIFDFNDKSTHAEVMKVLEEADV